MRLNDFAGSRLKALPSSMSDWVIWHQLRILLVGR